MNARIVDLIARNLKAAIDARGGMSLREIARRANVSPSSIRYILDPGLRSPTHKGPASPNLDVLERVTTALGLEVWQLMVGDFPPGEIPARALTAKESEFFERIKGAYEDLN